MTQLFNPYEQFLDATGNPVAGGTLTFYTNTTTTKTTVYSDITLTTTQANPYTLDASGRVAGDVYFSGAITIALADSNGAQIRTMDNVEFLGTRNIFYAENYSDFSAAVTAAAGKELVISTNLVVDANITVSGVTLRFIQGGNLDPDSGVTITLNTAVDAGNYEIFDSTAAGTIAGTFAGAEINVMWFGVTLDGSTDDKANLALADTAGATNGIFYPAGTAKISSAITLTAPQRFQPGAIIKPDAAVTVTINAEVTAGDYQIFDVSNHATTAIVTGSFVVSDVNVLWWGGTSSASSKAIKQGLQTTNKVRIPVGIFKMDTAVQLSQFADGYIFGSGEGSILEFAAAVNFFHKNTADQNAFGYRRKTHVQDLSFDGDSKTASEALLYGATGGGATLAGVDSTVERCFFYQFTQGIKCTFVENITVKASRFVDNDYGIFAEDADGEAAIGIHIGDGCNFSNSGLAGVYWKSLDNNSGLVQIHNAIIAQGDGFGVYLRGTSQNTNMTHSLKDVHFEANGQAAGNITIDGASRDPQHMFLRDCSVSVEECFFDETQAYQSQFVGARVAYKNCTMGGGSGNSLFNADSASTISIEDTSFDTANIDTPAIIHWGHHNKWGGSVGNWHIRCGLPVANIVGIKYPVNLITDPSFEADAGGVVASSTNAPTVTGASATDAFIGTKSLYVQYGAGAGDTDDNAARLMNAQSVPNQGFAVFTFFVKSDGSQSLKLNSTIAETSTIETTTSWTRVAIAHFNASGSPVSTTAWISPAAAGGPNVNFDAMQVTVCNDFEETQALLRGGVEGL